MAKKKAGTNHPAEILDDNGTLIATSAGSRGATAHAADEREALKARKRDIPEPS